MRHVSLSILIAGLVIGCGSKPEDPPPHLHEQGRKSSIKTDGSGSPAGPSSTPLTGPPGTVVVDDGFRPDRDGFKWENEGSVGEDPYLTVNDMRDLFGDENVCGQPMEGECLLTPAAEEWMENQLTSMKGGVCEGMAVAALAFFKKTEEAKKISESPGGEVKLTPVLKRMIGMYHVMQNTNPTEVKAADIREKSTPNDVLDQLTALLKGDDMLSFGFYKREGGGHAVVPISIESKGDDLFWLHIYDVNWPNVDRYLEFDRKKNTWKYDFAALNAGAEADLWEGDADTHSLDYGLMSWRTTRKCPFCKDSEDTRELTLKGKGHLLVKDKSGAKLGFEGGKLVSTIPKAHARYQRSYRKGQLPAEPTYFIPASAQLDVEIEGAGGADEDEDVAIFGMGTVVLLNDLKLSAGEEDHFTLDGDGQGIHYKPSGKESPVIKIALDGDKSDYLFEVRDLDVEGGDELTLDIDPATGKLKIFDSGKAADKYDIKIERFTGKKHEEFIKNDVQLDVGEADLIDYEAWDGEGKELTIEEDQGNDGTVDDTDKETDEPALQ